MTTPDRVHDILSNLPDDAARERFNKHYKPTETTSAEEKFNMINEAFLHAFWPCLFGDQSDPFVKATMNAAKLNPPSHATNL